MEPITCIMMGVGLAISMVVLQFIWRKYIIIQTRYLLHHSIHNPSLTIHRTELSHDFRSRKRVALHITLLAYTRRVTIRASFNTPHHTLFSSKHLMLGLLALITAREILNVRTSTLMTGPLNHLRADTNHQITTNVMLSSVSDVSDQEIKQLTVHHIQQSSSS